MERDLEMTEGAAENVEDNRNNEAENIGLTSGKAVPPSRGWLSKLVIAILFAFGIFLGIVIGLTWREIAPASQQYQQQTTVSTDQLAPLNFLVVGDWGRDGNFNQSAVADAMGVVAEEKHANFIVSTGDNFYNSGLSDTEDAQFDSSFSNVYTARSLQALWFAVLGNHDYGKVAAVQADPALKLRDPRWHLERHYTVKRSVCPALPQGVAAEEGCTAEVELFFYDTNVFLPEYWGGKLNFTGLGSEEEEVTKAVEALDGALAASTATWKLVIGHHPIRSMGTHGDTQKLIDHILPLLESYHVDLYINGHDHALEYIKRPESPIPLVTSGAGSMCYRNQNLDYTQENGLKFDHNGQGFVSVGIAPTWLHLDFHDIEGKVVYPGGLHLTK
eukprot:TRINITY_DN15283_c0_g1_i1.p1 TRINITY_DN15283_c0_g1~~TRINITY_DN15283_c0_g1_i1.p1  ORF type:complete len:388 (+),score=56.86 TRINITY_DN15283_c0_g1_i1:354-1517(+)